MKRLRTQTFVLFACLIGFSTMTTGCSAMFAKMFKKKKSYAQKKKERKAAAAKAKAEAMKTFPTWIKSGSCDTASKVYLKKYINHASTEQRSQAGIKFAKCGNWKFVFERIFASNRGWALKQLQALEKASLSTPVHKGLEKYIAETAEPFRSRYGFHILDFLRYAVDKSTQKPKYCKAFYSLAKKSSQIRYFRIRSKARRYGIGFLPVGNCRQYRGFIQGLLTSNWWIDRNLGCWVLGKWGTRSDLRRVSTLATTDGYMDRQQTRRYRYPVYPVRKTCRAAAGKIRIRN